MSKSRDIEVFGMSFMDMISCGLGGVIVLMLIFSTLVKNGQEQQGSGNAGDFETAEQAILRQQQRSTCNFYLEIDVLSPIDNYPYLYYELLDGVTIDSAENELYDSNWKRYSCAFSLEGVIASGEYPFTIYSDAQDSSTVKVRLLSSSRIEEPFMFKDSMSFHVRKIGSIYEIRQ